MKKIIIIQPNLIYSIKWPLFHLFYTNIQTKPNKFWPNSLFIYWLFIIIFFNTLLTQNHNIQFSQKQTSYLSNTYPQITDFTCQIGFIYVQKQQNPNSLSFVKVFRQESYDKFIINQSNKIWKYCKFPQFDSLTSQQFIGYSDNYKICRQKCCRKIQNSQCYFKTLQKNENQEQDKKEKRLRIMQTQSNGSSTLDQSNASSKPQQSFKTSSSAEAASTTTAVSATDPNNNDGSSGTGIQVLVVILACVFGVPFILLVFFSIITIVRLCRNNSGTRIGGNGNNHRNTPPQVIQPEIINLQQYNIDEIGPYLVNSKQQCPICLDDNINLRTFCGHHYHPKCLKAWFMKVRGKCPVCMGHRVNPMKIYCSKCSVALKLVVLNDATPDNEVLEITQNICVDCRSDQNSMLSRNLRREIISSSRDISSSKRDITSQRRDQTSSRKQDMTSSKKQDQNLMRTAQSKKEQNQNQQRQNQIGSGMQGNFQISESL